VLQEYAGYVAGGAVVVVLLLAWAVATFARSAGPGMRLGLRRRRPPRHAFGGRTAAAKRAGIIINPSKFNDMPQVKRRVTRASQRAGWAEPLFIETTVEDPGTGQALAAVAEGVDVVCVLGGDGTVRAVAEALAGTDTPMGLLPGGTSNLLARNLGLPVDSIESALRVAMADHNLRMDVGRLTVRRPPADSESAPESDNHAESAPEPDAEAGTASGGTPSDDRHAAPGHSAPKSNAESETKATDMAVESDDGLVFLVMAGLGLDAAIMADASEQMKAKVGWPAYFVSGFKNIRGPHFKVTLTMDSQPPITRRTRTVVIGNCGRLVGGLTLMPEADVTDGQLDAVIISPKGIVGWAAVLGRVLSRRRKGHERVDHHTAPSFEITADRAQEVQLDGDTIGKAVGVTATVQRRALSVRVNGQ
jgi:diacylglycerol kinase (ATP)